MVGTHRFAYLPMPTPDILPYNSHRTEVENALGRVAKAIDLGNAVVTLLTTLPAAPGYATPMAGSLAQHCRRTIQRMVYDKGCMVAEGGNGFQILRGPASLFEALHELCPMAPTGRGLTRMLGTTRIA